MRALPPLATQKAAPARRSARASAREITLSAGEARRIALAAQGFGRGRPRRATREHAHRTMDRLRLLQLDSIQVLVRAHYLPLFSRLGPYDRSWVDDRVYRSREWFEYWGHAASLLPARLHPLLRWRMEREPWDAVKRLRRVRPTVVEDVLARVEAHGPVVVGDLGHLGRNRGGMWGWGGAKHLLEWLFTTGRLATSSRRGFERVYDLSERVLPRAALLAPSLPPDEAGKALLMEAAEALGVGTARDLADYFRIRLPVARPLLAALLEEGRLVRVRVEGWRDAAFAAPGVRPPRGPLAARALLSPFDSLIFERDRTERLFGLRFRTEIYVPPAKRRYGYYVLPFLMDEALVARVDLKADRARRRLVVRAAHAEPGHAPGAVCDALAAELRLMASWLDLDRVAVERRGSLASPLRAAAAR